MIKKNVIVVLIVILLMLGGSYARASLIRDAEIEAYLKNLSAPVYKAAGMSADQVRMFIVNNDQLNAFVAGGSNMFLHTGLIMETQTPEMLISVIAHEVGHIAGGHLLGTEAAYERAQIGAVLSYLLGAATIAAGGGEVGAAILAGGGHAARQGVLAYTRANEQAADQAALIYFDQMGLSTEGMLMMFERLRREEKKHLSPDHQLYSRTHPLSKERITHIRNHQAPSVGARDGLSDLIHQRHQRVRAKLFGFLKELPDVLSRYPLSDTSDAAQVARAVAYSESSQLSAALSSIQPVIERHPDDPYLHELKGYLLLKAARTDEAVMAYKQARDLAPESALIRSDYAKALLAQRTRESMLQAKEELELSSQYDPTYHQTWRLLSRVYGHQGNTGMAELALAELAALNNNKKQLEMRLKRAQEYLDPFSAAGIRAEDLRLFAKTLDKDNKE